MSRRVTTLALQEAVLDVLADMHPMTLRQVFYQLVARQVLQNNRNRYQALSRLIVEGRKEGVIPWDWIEDRLRRPRRVSMWSGLRDFADTVVSAYRRDVWEYQPKYFEVWLEKDALSGIFEDVLEPYGVTLNVGRGFDGWSSVRHGAARLVKGTVSYFGDWDPSGEDISRSLEERLGWFSNQIDFERCALTREDIGRYNLPPDFTKETDPRRNSFVARYGDQAVELDALPPDVLRQRLIDEVEARMDLDALELVKARESQERDRLRDAMRGL